MRFTLRVDAGGGSHYPALHVRGDRDSLEWVLRYGTPEQVVEARWAAADIVHAYGALIGATASRRNRIVALIRAAVVRAILDEAAR